MFVKYYAKKLCFCDSLDPVVVYQQTGMAAVILLVGVFEVHIAAFAHVNV